MHRRQGRRWIAIAAVAVLTLVAIALSAMEAARWPGIGRALAWAVERETGWVVQQQRCRARLLTGSWLACERIALGADPWFDGRQARVDWRWGELWRWHRGGPLRLTEIGAQSLQLRLLRDAQGRATWQPPRRGTTPAQRDAVPQVGVVSVPSGDIEWNDALSDTQLAIALRAGNDDGSGGYRATIDGRWRQLPLALRVSTSELVPLLHSHSGATKHPLTVEGTAGAARIAFAGMAAALFGERDLDGAVQLAGPSLARVGEPLGLTLPQTPPFELRGQLAYGGGLWRLAEAQARIGRSQLGGDFAFDTRARPPALSGRLTGTRLVLQDLAPSIGARSDAPRPGSRGRVLPERAFDLPSLRAMQAQLEIDIDEFDMGTAAVRPLRELRTRLVLADGRLQLDDLDAVVAGGRLRGDTRLDEAKGVAQWSAQLRFEGVEIARWLPAVRKDTPARSPARASALASDAYVTGKLSAAVDVRGSGRSTAQILSSLDGRADATLRDGTLSHLVTEGLGVDIAQAVGVMVRGDRSLPLRCARVRLTLRNGVATLGPALVDNRDSTLRLAGNVDLGEETLALVVRSRPKDLSPLSLRAPVTVTGRWTDPVVGVDGRSLAGRVLGAAVLGAIVAPAAALIPLFDPGDRQSVDPCAEAATPTPKR